MFGLCAVLTACQPKHQKQADLIHPTYIADDAPGWQRQEGRLWLNQRLYSGWQYRLWPTGNTAFVGAFSQGKAEGSHRQWYSNGKLKEVRQYKNGWKANNAVGTSPANCRSFISFGTTFTRAV